MTSLLYRVFLLPLTVFFLIFAIPAAMAQQGGLAVKGVTVDVTADSALSARNKAFAEARRKAYEQLAAQYMPEGTLGSLAVPSDQVLSSMVRDFEIVTEKMTSHRYVGTIDVRFNPAVRNSFQTQSAATSYTSDTVMTGTTVTAVTPGTVSRAPIITGSGNGGDDYVYSPSRGNIIASSAMNTPVVTQQMPRPTLVLPWYGTRGRQTLWGQNNPWRTAWENSDGLSHDKMMPVLLPVGDTEDMRDYAPSQALSQGNVDSLKKRYRATDAVLAIAEPAEGGALIVSLYRMDGTAPVAIGRFGVDAGSGADTLKSAVDRALMTMRGMPQSSTPITPVSVGAEAPQSGVIQPIQTTPNAMYFVALARFNGLPQWVAMRNALNATPGVQGVDVQSISPSQAQVQFAFNGDNGSLSALLAQKGLQIAPLGANAAASVPGSMVPQFELTQLRSY